MPPRYIRASELGSFAFCRRAWFLERQDPAAALTQSRMIGATDRGDPLRTAGRPPVAARLSALLLILGVAGFACAALLTWGRP